MITKILIKYKLLEWAADTFLSRIFSTFDIGKAEHGKLKVGTKYKEVCGEGAVFYHVTIIAKGSVEEEGDEGYYCVYKYVKYIDSGFEVCFSLNDEMSSMTEIKFNEKFTFKNPDDFDDIELYLTEEDMRNCVFVPY